MTVPTTERDLTPWLVGDSGETRMLRQIILRLAPSELPIWIEGETGVGKEQVALALHAASGRRGAFVAVNVCAIASTMLEDAFFGHVRGAFTGSRSETYGHLGEANDGTLFLDEINGLPLEAQAALLRAVETRRYRQVGAQSDRSSRFRVIAASNESFDEMLRRGRFRQDLGYRLRGAVIQVPTLRARRADTRALASHFLATGPAGRAGRLTESAIDWLESQEWRGNVRELRQLLHCAQMLASGDRVGTDDLRSARLMIPLGSTPRPEPTDAMSCRERSELSTLLTECGWDTQRAAAALGVDRTTVYRRMRRLGIVAPRSTGAGRPSTWAPLARHLGGNAPSPPT